MQVPPKPKCITYSVGRFQKKNLNALLKIVIKIRHPDAPVKVYNLNGIYIGDSLDKHDPGFYIVRQGGKAKKVSIN